jgi:DNA uptake protein ComE-like DNA-binding protein
VGEREKKGRARKERRAAELSGNDGSFHGSDADADEESFVERPRKQGRKQTTGRQPVVAVFADEDDGPPTPRTRHLLDVVNSRDVAQIKALHGFGAKKARDLVDYLELKEGDEIQTLGQLRMVPGMGGRAVERAYEGLAV